MDEIVKTSFVGIYQGRTVILYIDSFDDAGQVVTFVYSATLAGDTRLTGKGSVDRTTCQAVLSTFDSRGRFVATANGWAFESIEPSWRLDSSDTAGATK